jgi:hypothetical protein
MRIAAYIFFACAILLLASSGYDEIRGSTSVTSKRVVSHYTREANPEKFRDAMTLYWAIGALLLAIGVAIYWIDKSQEKSDPMSPDHDNDEV